jgi:hypothetical protein
MFLTDFLNPLPQGLALDRWLETTMKALCEFSTGSWTSMLRAADEINIIFLELILIDIIGFRYSSYHALFNDLER